MSLQLKNPHSILAALEQRPRDVLEVHPPPAGGAPTWEAVRQHAAELGIRLAGGPRKTRKDRRRGGGHEAKAGREGGGAAVVRELPGLSLEELFRPAAQLPDPRGLWLALDCLQDPHNLGAILRTASFFAVRGALMTADRAAPLSAVVYDVASGGIEHVPFSIQTNLSRSLEAAKEAGLWVLGTSEHAEADVADVPRDRAWLLVIGNEAKGLRRLTAEHCDQMCRITPRGAVDSLNASVAAGILIAQLSCRAQSAC